MMKWDDIPKPIRIIIITIIILLLIWFGANVWRLLRKPANAKFIGGGGSIPEGWNKEQITDDLFNAFSGINILGGRYVPMQEFNKLNDNQKIAVYNDWNDRKAQKSIFLGMGSYGTLTNTLSKEDFLALPTEDLHQAELMTADLKRLQLP